MNIQNVKKILVVDDDKPIRDLLYDFFTSEGYVVATAEDGVAAIRKLRDDSYDILITDLMMPVMGGGEILDWVCKRDLEITSFVISASPFEHVMKHIKNKGAFAYIPKPFQLNHLSHMVKTALNRATLHG